VAGGGQRWWWRVRGRGGGCGAQESEGVATGALGVLL
jgi:hypothetical protein